MGYQVSQMDPHVFQLKFCVHFLSLPIYRCDTIQKGLNVVINNCFVFGRSRVQMSARRPVTLNQVSVFLLSPSRKMQ
jgi:hypothetical protein